MLWKLTVAALPQHCIRNQWTTTDTSIPPILILNTSLDPSSTPRLHITMVSAVISLTGMYTLRMEQSQNHSPQINRVRLGPSSNLVQYQTCDKTESLWLSPTSPSLNTFDAPLMTSNPSRRGQICPGLSQAPNSNDTSPAADHLIPILTKAPVDTSNLLSDQHCYVNGSRCQLYLPPPPSTQTKSTYNIQVHVSAPHMFPASSFVASKVNYSSCLQKCMPFWITTSTPYIHF